VSATEAGPRMRLVPFRRGTALGRGADGLGRSSDRPCVYKFGVLFRVMTLVFARLPSNRCREPWAVCPVDLLTAGQFDMLRSDKRCYYGLVTVRRFPFRVALGRCTVGGA